MFILMLQYISTIIYLSNSPLVDTFFYYKSPLFFHLCKFVLLFPWIKFFRNRPFK